MNLHIGLKGVLKYKDKILLLKRVNKISRGGKWDLPGGIIEEDEKLIEGFKREVLEETGLNISEISIPLEIGYFNDNIYMNKNVIRIIYLCRTNSKNVKLSPEHNKFKWVTLDELKKIKPKSFISPNILKILISRIEEFEESDLKSFDIKLEKSS